MSPSPLNEPGAASVAAIEARYPEDDRAAIRAAYETAARWHAGQLRRSGDPYVTHPVEVAAIVADLGLSPAAVCAAILHDTVDDTPYTFAQMRAEFGDDVTAMVEALPTSTELHRAALDVDASHAGSPDVEVLVIKLADRLHNLRTLQHTSIARQVRVARDTLETVAPIAQRLGLTGVRRELEEISLAYLRSTVVTDRPTRATLRLLELTTLLLPRNARSRWREEWAAEVGALPTRRARVMFTLQTLCGVPRLAWVLSGPRRAVVPTWVAGLTQLAQALGVGGAIVVVTATDSVFAWIAGGIVLVSLALLGMLLFVRSDGPARRLIALIRAWRRQ
ncbi:HD domain-containing protein [Catellatospora paridis]|uniref:HD domain-containing protein n=1 Tax=Catellatospora paridis TaxID=1617086 RepID=UPI0012D3C53F|nr:HD domain-containing protein [Catellatospora paridis]